MKQAHVLNETEKRNYFRIDDVAILHYKQISAETMVSADNRIEQATINKLTMKARFDSMTRELQPLLKMVAKSNSSMSHCLKTIDTKLNMLSEYVMESEIEDMNVKPQHVNIGAGGLSFSALSPLLAGAMIETRLVLLPENTGVFSYARVISCSKLDQVNEEGHQYRLGIEFVNMDESVRDLITRHVLCREQELLHNEKQPHKN